MANSTTKGTIVFSYDSTSLFDDVCLLSAYMVKNLASDNMSMLDEFSISDDERHIYDECLKQVMPNIYEAVIMTVPCAEGAFSDGTGDSETGVTVTLKDNHAYNRNVLTLVDGTLQTCIKYGVLAQFYSICVHEGLFVLAKEKYDTNLSQLKQRLFQLKKKPVSPQL